MSAAVDKLETTVRNSTDVMSSAATLLGNLSGMLRDVAGDATRTNALADELDARQRTLAQAVVDNTPAVNPPPTPAPAPAPAVATAGMPTAAPPQQTQRGQAKP